MLAVIAVFRIIAGLLTMPLAAATVIVAATWPIKPWLDRALPPRVSYLGTISIAAAFFPVEFTGAVYFAAAQVVRAFAQVQEKY